MTTAWVRPEPGWTCPECGFDFDACVLAETPATLRSFGRKYRAPLTRGLPGEDLDALLRFRPEPGSWCALEYACHVRDVFTINVGRVAKVLVEERPSFFVTNRDEIAIERNYQGADPVVVLDELTAAAESLAAKLEAAPADEWNRVGEAGGFELSIAWMARNAVHEATHHLLDIARVVRAARGR